MEPYEAYDAMSGARVLRIHYSADPEKDARWVAAERAKGGWTSAEWALEMELLDKQVTGALWNRVLLDTCRVDRLPDNIIKIAVGVDPSISNKNDRIQDKKLHKKRDECGIIVGCVTDDAHAYIINDLSAILSPIEWARVTCGAFSHYRANIIGVEDNQGGDMVKTTIHTVQPGVPVQKVRAKIGKRARAEPIASLYEQGRIHHVCYRNKDGNLVNPMSKLEDEQCGWDAFDPRAKSPNRIDALAVLMHVLGLVSISGVIMHSRTQLMEEEEYVF